MGLVDSSFYFPMYGKERELTGIFFVVLGFNMWPTLDGTWNFPKREYEPILGGNLLIPYNFNTDTFNPIFMYSNTMKEDRPCGTLNVVPMHIQFRDASKITEKNTCKFDMWDKANVIAT